MQTESVNVWNLKILMPLLFTGRVFGLVCNSTLNSLQAYDVTPL